MELSFANNKLKRLCEQEAIARKELGQDSATQLRKRLADIMAAACVTELVAGRPHPLSGDRAGQYSLSLAGGQRLVFAPDHDPVPKLSAGGIAWAEVTKVRVEFIGNYHD